MANDVNFDLKLAVDGFKQSLSQANNSVTSFHNDFKKNTNGSTQVWNSFVGNLGAKAVEYAVKGIANFASSLGEMGLAAVNNAGKLEMMSVELGVMLGSAEAGERQLKKLQDFAATSPFQLPGIVEANKLLLGFGTTVGDIPEVLGILGNVAAGSGKPLSDLARIFGQVQAETKLSLERMNQLNDAGIALGPTLANKLGIPLKDVRKAVTDGKVSFDLFRQAMVSIQAEGGTFAGGMIKQSQTLEGVISTLKDNVFNLSGEFGKSLLPMVKAGAIALIDFSQVLTNNLDNIKTAAISLGIASAAFGAYLVATNLSIAATYRFTAALLTNPFTAVAIGVLALGAAIFGLIKYWDDVKLAFLNGTKTILTALLPVEEAFNKLFNIDSTRISSALASVSSSVEELKTKINKKSEPIVDPAALEAEAKAAKEAALAKKVANDERLAEVARVNAVEAEARRIHNQELLLIEQEGILAQNELRTANEILTIEQRATREADDIAARQALEAAKLQLVVDAEANKAKAEADAEARKKAQKAAADKAEIQQVTLQNKLKLDANKQAAKSQKAINDQELQDRTTFLNTAASLQQSSNKTAQAIGKASALATLAIQTPQAIASSFAFGSKTGGPVLGAVFAGIAASAMAIQASKIAGVGNFENGGFIPGRSFSGDKLQANVNSGEAVLNVSQQKEFMKIANGGGSNNTGILEAIYALGDRIASIEVVMIADDNEIARSASRGVMNGIAIGSSR